MVLHQRKRKEVEGFSLAGRTLYCFSIIWAFLQGFESIRLTVFLPAFSSTRCCLRFGAGWGRSTALPPCSGVGG